MWVLNFEKSVVFSYWILIFCASTCRTSGSRKTSIVQVAAARAGEPHRAGDRLILRPQKQVLVACRHRPGPPSVKTILNPHVRSRTA